MQMLTLKMSFTKASSSQNVIRKSLIQIFCNLLDSRMFVLAKVCTLKAGVNPESSQTSKMELFAKLVGRFWPFAIFA